jgi:uncharacterized protein (DUF433 family)
MSAALIHDRGRGPELVGTRITVENLLPDLLNASLTETDICRTYGLNPQQLAAARSYVLSNPETVLADHLKIEEQIANAASPEMREQAQRRRELFLRFRDWVKSSRVEIEQDREADTLSSSTLPTFREWLVQQDAEVAKGV